eukprot:NODE_12_length_54577_cov_0.384100.p30 type:complete len:109 gc:universal NODE_12_length_54577_cov_0.384100:17508-17182(-)
MFVGLSWDNSQFFSFHNHKLWHRSLKDWGWWWRWWWQQLGLRCTQGVQKKSRLAWFTQILSLHLSTTNKNFRCYFYCFCNVLGLHFRATNFGCICRVSSIEQFKINFG